MNSWDFEQVEDYSEEMMAMFGADFLGMLAVNGITLEEYYEDCKEDGLA